MRQTAALWLCEGRIGGRLMITEQTVIDGLGGRSVQADRVSIGANIRILQESELRGELRLLSARIAGSLDIVSSQVSTHDELAVELAEARLGGSVFLARTTDSAAPTRIDGLLVMSDVIVGAFVQVKGAVLLGRKVRADGPYDRPIRHAQTVAFSAPRCEIGDDLYVDGRTVVSGGIVFPHATVLGDVLLRGVSIDNPDDRSLDLGRADVRGSLDLRNADIRGSIWLAGCEVGGSVVAEECELAGPSGPSMVLAAGLVIGGDLQLAGVRTTKGSLRFRSAQIRGEVDVQGAELNNPKGETLSLSNARVDGAVRLNDLVSDGLLVMNRAVINGRVQMTGAKLRCHYRWDKNVHGRALEIISTDLAGGIYLDWESVDGPVDFYSSRTAILADLADTWPSSAELSGFTYDRLDSPQPNSGDPWDLVSRLSILGTQQPFDFAPYEVAARVYSDHGRFADADQIRVIGLRLASEAQFEATLGEGGLGNLLEAHTVRLARRLYDKGVRFGFQPARALGYIAVLIGLVWLSLAGPWSASQEVMKATGASESVYSPSGPVLARYGADQVCGGDVRCFSSPIYAIETVVPLIEFDQRNTWRVDSTARLGWLYQAWLTAATVTGWVLSSVFVLSFARLGRTN